MQRHITYMPVVSRMVVEIISIRGKSWNRMCNLEIMQQFKQYVILALKFIWIQLLSLQDLIDSEISSHHCNSIVNGVKYFAVLVSDITNQRICLSPYNITTRNILLPKCKLNVNLIIQICYMISSEG